MKIPITGSGGFIGSFFCRYYSEEYELLTFPSVEDRFDGLKLLGFNAVLHFGALIHRKSGLAAESYGEINCDQTLSLAQKSKTAGMSKFVLMSTIKVYGHTDS